MKLCFCRVILAILVIVFAWLALPWTKIALTVVGGLLVILGLTGVCCCTSMKDKADTEKKSS